VRQLKHRCIPPWAILRFEHRTDELLQRERGAGFVILELRRVPQEKHVAPHGLAQCGEDLTAQRERHGFDIARPTELTPSCINVDVRHGLDQAG
jgi:hypothetical protein